MIYHQFNEYSFGEDLPVQCFKN